MVREPRFDMPPFAGTPEPAAFFIGPPQDEALARLEWLSTEGQRCGLVVGDSGCGKSHLAAATARRLGGLGAEVAVLSLRGLSAVDWLDMLLERLPLDAASRSEPLRPWQKLENRLRENTLMERTTVLVLDDVDAAPAEIVDGVTRLATAAEPRFARTLVVATTTPRGLGRLPESLRRRAVVRIELPAWNGGLTADYLAYELVRCGGEADWFTPEAAATIARCAGAAGPRREHRRRRRAGRCRHRGTRLAGALHRLGGSPGTAGRRRGGGSRLARHADRAGRPPTVELNTAGARSRLACCSPSEDTDVSDA